jgi:hypothetical protein
MNRHCFVRHRRTGGFTGLHSRAVIVWRADRAVEESCVAALKSKEAEESMKTLDSV